MAFNKLETCRSVSVLSMRVNRKVISFPSPEQEQSPTAEKPVKNIIPFPKSGEVRQTEAKDIVTEEDLQILDQNIESILKSLERIQQKMSNQAS